MQLIPTGEADKPRNQFPPVSVGETLIPEADIAAELQHHPATEVSEAWHQAARSLVVRELLRQDARRQGIDGDCEETVTSQLLEQQLAIPDPDDADCRRYYDANPERFRSPTLLAASHILLPAAPDDGEARQRQQRLGEELLALLSQGGASFEALAREHSACESRHQGGSLGQLVPGQTVTEFERPLWHLPEGIASTLIESRYGWHLVRIDQRIEGRMLPFEQAKPRVRQLLLEGSTRRALRQYLLVLAAELGVEGVDLEVSGSPLLQ